MPGRTSTVDDYLRDLLVAIQASRPHNDDDCDRFIAYTEAAAEFGRITERMRRIQSVCAAVTGWWLSQGVCPVQKQRTRSVSASVAAATTAAELVRILERTSAEREAARERLLSLECKPKDNPALSKSLTAPATPAALRAFVLAVLELVDRRDRMLAGPRERPLDLGPEVQAAREKARFNGRVLTGYAEAIWKLLRRVAGERPFPPFNAGPFTRATFQAALAPVLAWCDEEEPPIAYLTPINSVAPPNETDPARVPCATVDAQKDQGERKVKGKHIDAKMLKVLSENRAAYDWTARQWAVHLKCSDGTVKQTKTWKGVLNAARAGMAAEGAMKMDKSNTRPAGGRKARHKSQW